MSSCLSSRQARDPGCQEEPQGTQGFRRCLWQGTPKIQSQESNFAGEGRGKREQAICAAHVVSSLSSDSGFFPHALCGEFCNQILLREAHVGRPRVDPSRGPVLMLSSTESNTGEIHIWSSFYFLQRQKLLFIKQCDPGCSISCFSSSSSSSRA